MDSLPIRAIRVIRGHEADAHALEWADVSRRLQWCLTSPMLAALSHAPPAPSRSLSRRRFLRTAAAAGLTAPVILPSGLLLGTVAIPFTRYFREKYGVRGGDFPVTEALADRALSLPLYPGITEEQQRTVVATVLECL